MSVPEFRLADADESRLEPGIYGLRDGTPLSVVHTRLEQAGWATAAVDLTAATRKRAVMAAFADGLDLPSWFGANWDALEDALRDLTWWPAGTNGRIILILGDLEAPATETGDGAVLQDVLGSTVDWWASTGSPMLVVLIS